MHVYVHMCKEMVATCSVRDICAIAGIARTLDVLMIMYTGSRVDYLVSTCYLNFQSDNSFKIPAN